MKSLARAILRFLLVGLFQLFRWLPFRWSSALAAGLMVFVSWFLRRHRRIAQDNLKHAYPSEGTKYFSRVITGCFKHIGLTIVELIRFGHRPQEMLKRISVEGLEHLDQALSQGRGVVAVTAHLGNFPLMIGCLALKGYSSTVILKPPRDQKLNSYFSHRWENISGARIIYSMPRQQCIQESLKTLRGNGLLFILPDQNFGDDGRVFVPFFGRPAATGTGALVFARRSGAAVVPVFMIRQSDGTHKIIIEKPLDIQEAATEEEALLIHTRKLTATIERYVRQYPDQWLWFHKRWKTRPQEKE